MSALEHVVKDIVTNEDVVAAPAANPQTDSGRGLRRWFAQRSISDKLRLFSRANFVVMGITALTLIIGLQQLDARYEAHQRLNLAALTSADLGAHLADARFAAAQSFSSRNAADVADARRALDETQRLLAGLALAAADADQDLQSKIARFEIQQGSYAQQIGSLTSFTGSNVGTRDDLTRTIAENGASLSRQAHDIKAGFVAAADASEATGFRFFYGLLVVLVLVGILAVGVAAAGSRFLTRDISDAIQRLTASMKTLSTGEKNIDVPFEHRSDEIGEMARALDIFRRVAWRYEKLSTERAEAAKVELEMQVDAEREREKQRERQAEILKRMADKFEQTVGDVVSSVAAASTQLKTTAGAMAASAETSSSQAGRVAHSMQEASGGVTAAAAASDEFAMSIGEISRQAATSAELARKASESADLADVKMSTLSQAASQVGQIVELIQSIARRTNLLALNASIEAARGGEAGRGFAVVASEVKELAAQTSRATQEVADQIRAMQNSTSDGVHALRAIGEQVQQLETTAISIASAVDQQSVAGQDLARSIDLAARSSGEVSSSITNVRESSLATGAAAAQVLNSATDLEGQAANLRNHVDGFMRRIRADG